MEELFDEVFASDSDAYTEYFDNRRSENDKKNNETIAKKEEWEYWLSKFTKSEKIRSQKLKKSCGFW